MKITFIGGGNMGGAMLAAILEKGLAAPAGITVGDVSEDCLARLKDKYGVAVTGDNRRAVAGSDVVVLAVKPQTLGEVAAGLKGALEPSQLVISILAGARIAAISDGLGHGRVVRVMPNTPAQIGAGISAWTASPQVTAGQKEQARAILGATGREVYFDDEKYLDMATAVSGSGPAYFFLMAEAMIEAAVGIGLARDAAETLVIETMLGAARLLKQSGETPAGLRRKVTSPGGTTAAALGVLEQGDFAGLVQRAVAAACRRAQELGK